MMKKMNEKISSKISLNEYLGLYGLSSPISDYWIDKMVFPHGLTSRQKKKLDKEGQKAAKEYSEKRQACIKEYYQKVAIGEIIEPTKIEKLIKTASGHRDNPSVQAARRLLVKKGYWVDAKGEWQKVRSERNLYMSKDWSKQELQTASEQMKKQGNLGYDDFTKQIDKQETSQKYVEEIKKNYNIGNLEKAYEYWCKLYDLYELNNEMTTEERVEEFKQLNSYTSQIEDKIVYAVTDYGREKHYIEQGFYDDIVEEQEKDELDITDNM